MPTARPFTPTEQRIGNLVIRYMSKLNTWLYRTFGGRFVGAWIRGEPIGLLVYRGRKTGRTLTTPLIYLTDGERIVIAGSNAGMPRDPLWCKNLAEHPDCEFEIGRERKRYRARLSTPEERKTTWPRLVAMHPDYESYQARAGRDIPIIVLEPSADRAA